MNTHRFPAPRAGTRWGGPMIVIAGCLLGLMLGLAGAVFGWVAQLFVLGLVLPLLIIVIDYRAILFLAVLVLPYSNAKFIPKVGPLSIDNVVLLGVLLSFALHWSVRRMSGRQLRLPVSRQLVWLFLLPLTVATVIGTFHLHEIPFLILAKRSVQSYGLKEYWISLYLKQILTVFAGCAMGAVILDKGRSLALQVVIVVSGVLLSLMLMWLIVGSGLSLKQAFTLRALLLVPLGMHPNELGPLMAFPFAAALFMREGTSSTLGRMALLGAAAMMVVGVALTFSRGSLLALLVVAVAYVLSFRRVGVILGAATVALAGFALAPEAVQNRLLTGIQSDAVGTALSSSYSDDALTAGRVYVWQTLAPEILDNPFFGNGQGSMQWSSAIRSGAFPFEHTHNLFLGLLLDAGLVGTLAVLAFYVYVGRTFLQLGKDTRLDPKSRHMYSAAFAGFVSFLVYGLTNGYWGPLPNQPFMWMFLGMAIAHQRLLGPPASGSAEPAAPRWAKRAVTSPVPRHPAWIAGRLR